MSNKLDDDLELLIDQDELVEDFIDKAGYSRNEAIVAAAKVREEDRKYY